MIPVEKWVENNINQRIYAELQQRLAETVINNANQLGEDTIETANKETQRADRRIDERVQDLEFFYNELQIQKDQSVNELDILLVYKRRTEEALEACLEPLKITRKCIEQRGERIGIELVMDLVSKCLKEEENIILESQKNLRQTISQATEQIRMLRANQYNLDKDLGSKESAIRIDRNCANLNFNSPELNMKSDGKAERSRSMKEWEYHTKQNILNSNQQVKQSRNLRSKIDNLLKKVHENIVKHYEETSRAFNKRIRETKEAKQKLENELAENTRQANNVRSTITKLEEPMEITDKHIALTITRMNKRAQRKGIEQCRDAVELQLEKELNILNRNFENLKLQQEQAEAGLRCLRRSIEKLSEDLNKKINSLMIDEVLCMTQRLSMNFHIY